MVLRLLGLGKKSEYFLEAPPADNGAAPAAKVANKVAEVANKVTDTVADKVAEVTDKVSAPSAAPTPAQPELTANGAVAGTNEAQPKTKKLKKSKVETTEAKTTGAAPAKPASKPVAPPEPVKNFATDFLMPSTTPRRRPGPSLNAFRDMARGVKTPKS